MRDHHRQAIERLVAELEGDSRFLAALLAGSVAAVMNFRDWEKPSAGISCQFMEDSEWHWRRGPAPEADR